MELVLLKPIGVTLFCLGALFFGIYKREDLEGMSMIAIINAIIIAAVDIYYSFKKVITDYMLDKMVMVIIALVWIFVLLTNGVN
jgi:hypothetical protein